MNFAGTHAISPQPLPPSMMDQNKLSQFALQTYNPSAVNVLYCFLPHKCSTCGLRMKTANELSLHLDVHYFDAVGMKMKNNAGSGIKNGSVGANRTKVQRQWYLNAEDWVHTCGGLKMKKNSAFKSSSVTAPTASIHVGGGGTINNSAVRISDMNSFGENNALCKTCGDEIDSAQYDDAGWFLPNTSRDALGQLYHCVCLPVNHISPTPPAEHQSYPSNGLGKRMYGDFVVSPAYEPFDELVLAPSSKRRHLDGETGR